MFKMHCCCYLKPLIPSPCFSGPEVDIEWQKTGSFSFFTTASYTEHLTLPVCNASVRWLKVEQIQLHLPNTKEGVGFCKCNTVANIAVVGSTYLAAMHNVSIRERIAHSVILLWFILKGEGLLNLISFDLAHIFMVFSTFANILI